MASDLDALKDRISTLLKQPGVRPILQLNRNQVEKAYEVYLLALVAKAVSTAGGTHELVGVISGARPNPVVIRGGPGQIWSNGSDFAYLDCKLGGKHFEGHISVTFEGNSGASHEIDVSLISRDHAENARQERLSPRTNQNNLLVAVECKFYGAGPGVSLGRTFAGLVGDCSGLKFKAFACNNRADGLDRFLSRASAPENFTGLSPMDPRAERLFIGALGHALRQWSAGK